MMITIENPRLRRRVTDKEINLMLENFQYKDTGNISLLMLETIMRFGEVISLDWANIDLKNKVAHVYSAKSNSQNELVLSDKAIAILKSMNPKESGLVFDVNANKINSDFLNTAKKCGIENLKIHYLRYESFFRLAKRVDIETIAKMVGCNYAPSLMIYYNPTST